MINMPKVVPEYKEAAKERIIQAALQVYSEKGYHETTMKEVAHRLGVSKGALYLYFKSKNELLAVIIERWNNNMRNILVTSFEDKDLNKNLNSLFNQAIEDPINRMGLGFDLISEASRNPAMRKVLSGSYEKNLRTLAEFLQKQNTKHSLQNVTNTQSQALILMSLQLGLMVSIILGTDEKSVRTAWNQSIKAIIKT